MTFGSVGTAQSAHHNSSIVSPHAWTAAAPNELKTTLLFIQSFAILGPTLAAHLVMRIAPAKAIASWLLMT